MHDLATFAAKVGEQVTAFRAGEFGTPDRTTLLAEISTLESQVVAL